MPRVINVPEAWWFALNQDYLLSLANHPDHAFRRDARACLGLPVDWPVITRCLAHGVHGLTAPSKGIAQFASRPVWARQIRSEWRWWESLARGNARRLWQPDEYGRRIAADSAPFYPDSGDPGVTTFDGHVALFGSEGTSWKWSDLHDAASGTIRNAPALSLDPIRVGLRNLAWSPPTYYYYQMNRGMCLFNVASLGLVNITGATFSLYVHTKQDAGNYAPSTNIYAASPASNTTLALTDYAYSHYGTAPHAAAITWAGLALNQRNDWTFNGDGKAAITSALGADGIAKLGIRSHYDVNNTAPVPGVTSTVFSFYAYSAEYAGGSPTSYHPLLTVEFTEAGTPVIGRGPRGRLLILKIDLPDGSSRYYSAHDVRHPDWFARGKVTRWGTLSRAIGRKPGSPVYSDLTVHLSEFD